jgi:hypothetical protein
MRPERWREVSRIYGAVLTKPEAARAAALAEDPQFRARFDREAKAIAALNHPHICTL